MTGQLRPGLWVLGMTFDLLVPCMPVPAPEVLRAKALSLLRSTLGCLPKPPARSLDLQLLFHLLSLTLGHCSSCGYPLHDWPALSSGLLVLRQLSTAGADACLGRLGQPFTAEVILHGDLEHEVRSASSERGVGRSLHLGRDT